MRRSTPSRLAWCLSVLALALSGGCGARSGMLLPAGGEAAAGAGGSDAGPDVAAGSGGGADAGGTGGAGGPAGTGATGGGAGAGGTGGGAGQGGAAGAGAATLCETLAPAGAPISFEEHAKHDQFPPVLSLTADPSIVAIGAAEVPIESSGSSPARFRVGALDLLGAWPSSLGFGSSAGFVVGVDQFAMGAGASGALASIAYPVAPSPPSTITQGVLFSPDLDPTSGEISSIVTIAPSSSASEHIRFVSAGNSGHLVGYQRASTGSFALNVAWAPASGGAPTELADMGCANRVVLADAIPSGTGHLLALSSSRELGDCGFDGPAGRVHVAWIEEGSASYSVVPVGFAADDEAAVVRLLPHGQGAWLVHQYAGINAESPGPVIATLLTPAGSVLASFPILDGNLIYTEPSFATLGDQLVAAWIDLSDPLGGLILIRIFDETGTLVTQTDYYIPEPVSVLPRLALLGAADSASLLVGWSQSGTGADENLRARLIKLDCVAGSIDN